MLRQIKPSLPESIAIMRKFADASIDLRQASKISACAFDFVAPFRLAASPIAALRMR
jgi:hypothetical protein